MKQNPEDTTLTLDELRQMVQDGSYSVIMKKILRYAKNVSVKEQLKATISQVGTPTIFWTLSMTDFHLSDIHDLLSENVDCGGNLSSDVARRNIIENPHIVNWLFTVRVHNFVKFWLYKTMGAT